MNKQSKSQLHCYIQTLNKSLKFLSPEDGDRMFLQNNGIYLQVHVALQPEDQHQHLHHYKNLKSQIAYTLIKKKKKGKLGILSFLHLKMP
jgi:hypothetical protein